jgi:hypothetical protein
MTKDTDEGKIFVPVADMLDRNFKNALHIFSLNINVQYGMCYIDIYDFPMVAKVDESWVLCVQCCRYWITGYENNGTTYPS